MSRMSEAASSTPDSQSDPAIAQHGHGPHPGGMIALAVGAVGVVFGDIGTSPIYAFRETFASHHGAPGIQVDPVHIHGVLSLAETLGRDARRLRFDDGPQGVDGDVVADLIVNLEAGLRREVNDLCRMQRLGELGGE